MCLPGDEPHNAEQALQAARPLLAPPPGIPINHCRQTKAEESALGSTHESHRLAWALGFFEWDCPDCSQMELKSSSDYDRPGEVLRSGAFCVLGSLFKGQAGEGGWESLCSGKI